MKRFRRQPRRFWIASAFVMLAAGGGLAVADASPPGEVGPALGLTANGRKLNPVGRMTTVGNFPTGSALTRNGRYLWVTDCGHGSDDVAVISVATGAVQQTLPLPGCYGGIAFTRDGAHAYVAGTPTGSSPTEGPVKGAQGDVVHVFTVDPSTGRGVEGTPLQLPSTTGGSGRTNSLPPTSGGGSAYPEGVAISPDQTKLVVALNEADKAVIVDLRTLTQSTVSTGAYPNGVAFDHRGLAYVSNEYAGTVTVIDPATASVVTTIAGLGGKRGDLNSHPEGMAADPGRDRIYVAVTNRDLIATIDTTTKKVVALTSVARPQGIGTAPVKLTVAPDGQTLYVADSGEDAIAAVSLAARPAAGVPVIPRRVARAPKLASIYRYRAAARRAAAALRRGQGRAGRARARRAYHRRLRYLRRHFLYVRTRVACSGPTRRQANVYVRAVLRALSARRASYRRRLLARARRLLKPIGACRAAPGYVPNLPAMHLIGRLPTAAYPDDVQVTPDGSQLLWVAGKGLGSGPNSNYYFGGDKRPGVTPTNIYGTYVLDQLLGRVGALPTPTDAQMAKSTALANAEVVPADAETQPAGSPVPAQGQGASPKIKHVFYIVRENRTYDQVFGSDPRGDGDRTLELFDDNGVKGPTGGITPNAHALAHQFPLIDHFYANSEVSVDGHIVTTGGYATDYVQKALAANYSNRNRGFDFGIYPVTAPPNDYIFDQAVRQGISFRDYGEAVGTTPTSNAPNRPTYSGVEANTDNSYPNNLFIGCLRPAGAVGNLATCTQDSGTYKSTGKKIAAQSRFDEWYPQFQQQVAAGTVPRLNYMILPNDHTNGTTANDYSPQALIADNDLGLGQIVDAISHSSIWSSTAIFVVEDDSQDGADHVDSHRMPALVISPWARHGAVVPTRYDQYSMLRTIELITGIDPLSLNDGLATPMYDAFVSGGGAPDETPYIAIAPAQNIGQVNGISAPLARLSSQLPWNRIDEVPQEISDQTLWASVHGASSTPPPPGPNASPVEHQRAVVARSVLARHGNVRAFLAGRGDG